jgi:hypothetical protein
MRKLFVFLFSYTVCILNAQQMNTSISLKLELKDGSLFNGISNIHILNLNSTFGYITVPISKIEEIRFSSRINNQLTDSFYFVLKSNKLISFDSLINSNASLEFYMAANRLLNDSSSLSNQKILVLNKIINVLSDKYNNYDLTTPSDTSDELDGTDFSNFSCYILNLTSIKLKNKYGEFDIPINDIKTIDLSNNQLTDSAHNRFVLSANKNIAANPDKTKAFVNTGLYVRAGQKIFIDASGIVTLQSLGGKNYSPSGEVVSSDQTKSSLNYSNLNDLTYYSKYGALCFKIGEDGEVQKAGVKFSTVSNSNGTLYLTIYETVFNQKNTGRYIATVFIK